MISSSLLTCHKPFDSIMGNCSPKGVSSQAQATPGNTIRVLTDSGSTLYFQGPKVVRDVVQNFPGYGIFEQGRVGGSWCPLPHDEKLATNQFYQLLPLGGTGKGISGETHMDGTSLMDSPANRPGLEVTPVSRRGDGVWKVKLVIDPKQLEEIMSEEGNVEALIERMREAASGSSSSRSSANGAMTQSPKGRKLTKEGSAVKPLFSTMFRTTPC